MTLLVLLSTSVAAPLATQHVFPPQHNQQSKANLYAHGGAWGMRRVSAFAFVDSSFFFPRSLFSVSLIDIHSRSHPISIDHLTRYALFPSSP